jgi:hypothetical protein
MAVTSADQDALAPPERSRLWWFEWQKRTAIGGYRRIQGALSNLGYDMARSTIAEVLKRHGIEPAPERSRKTTWKEFLSWNWELIVAADFFTVEVWARRGLQRFLILFFLELSTRKLEIAGSASIANGLWMTQIGRNVTDAVDGILNGKRYLIHDRDPLFTAEFLSLVASVGVQSVKLPPRKSSTPKPAVPSREVPISDRLSMILRPCVRNGLDIDGMRGVPVHVINFPVLDQKSAEPAPSTRGPVPGTCADSAARSRACPGSVAGSQT